MKTHRLLRTSSFRLATLYAVLFAVSTGVLFAIVYWLASNALRAEARLSLEKEMQDLVTVVETASREKAVAEITSRLVDGARHDIYYGLHDRAGNSLAGDLPALPGSGRWQELTSPNPFAASREGDLPDEPDTTLLVLSRPAGKGLTLSVALDTFRIGEAQEAIVRAFVWAGVLGIALALFGGVLLSGGFLRRIDELNRTVDSIIAGKLNERLRSPGTGDELDHLGRNINEMLDRIQATMESLKQVSNDIAHDLRTPLSRLRQNLESVRSEARQIGDYEAAVDKAIADTDAILSTFSALLRIAQIEAGSRKASFAGVDLSGTFNSVVNSFSAVAEDQGHRLVASIAPGIECHGDRELLIQMLVNLIVNAIRYTPQGSDIAVSLADGPHGPVGIVADEGPGIPPEAREDVFKRFFRLEQSRTTPGSGLGLSLVSAVARLHGIAITLADNNPGLKVILEFPRSG